MFTIKKKMKNKNNVYNQIVPNVWRNNSVYKLTTDKLQSMLISVLIRSIFEHYTASHGSGVTRLKCVEIFNESTTKSLLSLQV